MTYRILFETRAKREFLKLPHEIQEIFSDVIDDLAKNPRPLGVKKLSGMDGYRLRKGNYRMLFIIDDLKRELTVYAIGHRKDIYR